MLVECKTNLFKNIHESVYKDLYGYTSNTELPIQIGQQSIVYSITTIKKHLWYLVDVDDLAYPMYYPSQCFKIIDGRLSKYWIAMECQDYYDNMAFIIKFGYKEFLIDDYFYGELIEDNPIQTEIFLKYKTLLYQEFRL